MNSVTPGLARSQAAGMGSVLPRMSTSESKAVREARRALALPGPLNARELLSRYPGLRHHPEVVMELAYEEYRRRTEGGEVIDPNAFRKQFPGVEDSLGCLLELDSWVGKHEAVLMATAPMVWPEPGDVLCGYELLRQLGKGGFARVYLAAELGLGDRLVALKVTEGSSDEGVTLASLRHPNLLEVYRADTDPVTGLTALTMPYVGSVTLQDVIETIHAPNAVVPESASAILAAVAARGAREEPVAASGEPAPALRDGSYVAGVLHLGAQLADALAYIHGRSITHRDLKPSNVLISPQGQVFLIDFNLSAHGDGEGQPLGGTWQFMAPEQLDAIRAGDAQRVGPKSDLFALGIILYQLLAGSHPLGARAAMSCMDGQRRLPAAHDWIPLPLSEACPRPLPAGVVRLVESLLAVAPGERPACAAEVAQACRELERRLALPAPRGHIRRRTLGVAALLALMGCVLPLDARFVPPNGRPTQPVGAAEQTAPTTPAAWIARGKERVREAAKPGAVRVEERFQEALHDFRRASKVAPSAEADAGAGFCCARLGYLNNATYHYGVVLQQNPRWVAILNNLGVTYFRLANERTALRYLDEAVALRPSDPVIRYNRALANFTLADRLLLKYPHLIEPQQSLEAAAADLRCSTPSPRYLPLYEALLCRIEVIRLLHARRSLPPGPDPQCLWPTESPWEPHPEGAPEWRLCPNPTVGPGPKIRFFDPFLDPFADDNVSERRSPVGQGTRG